MVKDMVRIGVMMACLVSCFGYAAGEALEEGAGQQEDDLGARVLGVANGEESEWQESYTAMRPRKKARRHPSIVLCAHDLGLLRLCTNFVTEEIEGWLSNNEKPSSESMYLALNYAIKADRDDIVSLFIQHGFSVNYPSQEVSLLTLAKSLGFDRVADVLERAGATE